MGQPASKDADRKTGIPWCSGQPQKPVGVLWVSGLSSKKDDYSVRYEHNNKDVYNVSDYYRFTTTVNIILLFNEFRSSAICILE